MESDLSDLESVFYLPIKPELAFTIIRQLKNLLNP